MHYRDPRRRREKGEGNLFNNIIADKYPNIEKETNHIPSAINHGFLSLWIVRNEMSDDKKMSKWCSVLGIYYYTAIKIILTDIVENYGITKLKASK